MSAWEPFRDLIPESERGCFVDAYKKRLNSNDIETQVSVSGFLFSACLSVPFPPIVITRLL